MQLRDQLDSWVAKRERSNCEFIHTSSLQLLPSNLVILQKRKSKETRENQWEGPKTSTFWLYFIIQYSSSKDQVYYNSYSFY